MVVSSSQQYVRNLGYRNANMEELTVALLNIAYDWRAVAVSWYSRQGTVKCFDRIGCFIWIALFGYFLHKFIP